jgi:hypothetical protein
MSSKELAVVAVLLILMLLLGGVVWVSVTLLACGESSLAGASSASSWASTPVGELWVDVCSLW